MRFGRLLLLVALAAVVVVVSMAASWLSRPLVLAAETVEVSIEPGRTPREIADAWVRAGVQTSPLLLYQWFRWSGRARQIRAGSYEIGTGTTPIRLLDKMVRGDETLAAVRFNEGWTFRQIRGELARAESLKPSTASLSDAEVMAALGAASVSPEGRFHPDTYLYSKGSSDLAVLKRAYRAMEKRLAEAWQERDPATPLHSADEALTLASIVEKETGTAADRGRVAGVFVNRLRLGMPLQTDPTIIFGLGTAFDGNLRKRDLLADGPYNTYTRAGLPPTPIAMPGLASLRSALRPGKTDAMYYVSKNDGSSHFSRTLEEHNRAVTRYQLRGGK